MKVINNLERSITMSNKLNVGFIGVGNMASAIIEGMSQSPYFEQFNLSGFDHNPNGKFEKLNQKQSIIQGFDNFEEFLKQNNVVFLGIKPQGLDNFAQEFVQNEKLSSLWKEKTIISMMGGTSWAKLHDVFGHEQIIRIMPNINAALGESTTGVYAKDEKLIDTYQELLKSFGDTYIIDEKDFDLFAAISGSAPAIIYLLIDSLANSAVKQGMRKDLATKIVASMVKASGDYTKQKLAPNQNARNLVDLVSSPGGTTIKGIMALEENRFEASLNQAIEAMLPEKETK